MVVDFRAFSVDRPTAWFVLVRFDEFETDRLSELESFLLIELFLTVDEFLLSFLLPE